MHGDGYRSALWMDAKKYAKTMQLHYANRGKKTARAKMMEMM